MSMKPSPPETGTRPESISVIYVDDYEELCELTAEGLDDASDRLEVETTTDPTAVPGRLDEFDCVVADYAMPEMDGLELLRRVRVTTEELPFILYTGKGDENVASDAISLGVTDYLAKTGGPERFVRLAHRVENVVEARRASAQANQARQRARAAIERERGRLRALLEYSPTVTGVLDGSGRFQFLSPSVEDVTGFQPQELRGETAFEYIHEDDRERAERAFERVIQERGRSLSVEIRFREREGGWRHIEVRGTNHLENPDVEGVILNGQDVTGRKRTQGQLRRERTLTQRVFEVAPSPLLLLGEEGRIRRVNDRATEVFDADRATLQGHRPAESSVTFRNDRGEDFAAGEDLWELVSHARRSVQDAECVAALPGGDYRLQVSAAPIEGTDERYVVVAVEDAEPLPSTDDENT
jgi:PAS domain S-box-containing protein